MTPFVCFVSMVTIAMVSLLVPLTTASPLGEAIEPQFALEDMEPDHACLFICNMCFTDVEDTDKLMACSNKVCGSVMEGKCAMEKFIWLGRHCKHYDVVEMFWTASKGHSKDKFHALA